MKRNVASEDAQLCLPASTSCKKWKGEATPKFTGADNENVTISRRDMGNEVTTLPCQLRRNAEIGAILNDYVPLTRGAPIINFSSSEACKSPGCPIWLLPFLKRTRSDPPEGLARDRWHIRAFTAVRFFGIKQASSNDSFHGSNVFTICPTGPNATVDTTSVAYGLQSSIILPTQTSDGKHAKRATSFLGKVIDPYSFDYRDTRLCIDACIETHRGTCSLKMGAFPLGDIELRVIQCSTRHVVPLPDKSHYVCLSYVWGDASPYIELGSELPRQATTLPAVLPRAIEHAIDAVLRLQECYLWVDRYCIDQHSESKKKQIASMATIYEQAIFTVVALDDAKVGLPGISETPRQPQHSFTVQGVGYILTSPSLHQCLEGSKWATRGWTYQEAVLSTRCVFFTTWPVFFSCQHCTIAEELATHTKLLLIRARRRLSSYHNPPMLVKPTSKIEIRGQARRIPVLETQLQTYMARKLSFEADRLNAFRGVLNRSPHPNLWGVLVYTDIGRGASELLYYLGCGLSHGLLWQYAEESLQHDSTDRTRHEGFPTWSWAAALGPVRLFPLPKMTKNQTTLFDLYYDSGRIKFAARITVRQDRSVGPFGEFLSGAFPSGTLPEQIKLQVESLVVDLTAFDSSSDLESGCYKLSSTVKSKDMSEAETTIFWDPEAAQDRRAIALGDLLLSLVLLLVEGNHADGALFEDAIQLSTYEYDLTYHWLAVCSKDGSARRVGVARTHTQFGRKCLSAAGARQATVTLA